MKPLLIMGIGGIMDKEFENSLELDLQHRDKVMTFMKQNCLTYLS